MKYNFVTNPQFRLSWKFFLIIYSVIITCLWLYRNISSTSAGPQAQTNHQVSAPFKSSAPDAVLNNSIYRKPATLTNNSSIDTANPPKIDWTPLESEDFAVYAQNLRDAGLPERVVRQIMTAEVRASFDQDRMALVEKENTPFWDASYDTDQEMAGELAQVAEQEAAFLASLVGPLDAATVDEINSRRLKPALRFGKGLDAEKKQAVTEVFDCAREAIIRAPIDNLADELTRIDAQREAELTALLTPQEREDFEIRNSPIGEEIRHAIREQGGQVSEEQFRQLFRLKQDLIRQMEAEAGNGLGVTAAFEEFEALLSQAVTGKSL